MKIVIESQLLEQRISAFAEFLERLLEFSDSPLDLGKFPREFFRVDTSNQAALGTGEFRVCFYPSDAFIDFESAIRARYGQLLVRDFHDDPLSAQAESLESDGLGFSSVLEALA